MPTWGATIAAGVAAFYAWRAWRHEVQRDESATAEAIENRLREQAHKIAGWTEADSLDLVVINASDLPVFEAVAFLAYSVSALATQPDVTFGVGTIPPRMSRHPLVFNGIIERPALVQLAFTDAARVRWMRQPDGRLEQDKSWNDKRIVDHPPSEHAQSHDQSAAPRIKG